ncbi:MAG: hypothetical protein Q4F97_07570 [Bacteroidales bacterium]|nr:hypothetical protein [Bacteroidales bacterium]
MKKSLFSLLTLSLLFTVLFTSCLGDSSNKISSYNLCATVNGSDGVNILYEADGSKGLYFYSEAVTNSLVNLNIGDRIYLTKFTIDYDNQESGVNGSLSKPYKMTNVTFEKIEVSPVLNSQDVPTEATDKLTYFDYPYIVNTTQGYYMNLAGTYPKGSNPKFYLSSEGVVNDTIVYTLNQKYTSNDTSMETEVFINTYRVYISGSKFIKISFNSKEQNSYIKTPGYIVLPNTENATN